MIHTLSRQLFKFSRQKLSWRIKNQMLEFLVYDPQEHGKILYLVDNQVTFPELKQRQLFQQYQFTLPSGIDQKKPVVDILVNQDKPIDIKVSSNGDQYILKNRSSQLDQKVIQKVLETPGNLYSKFNAAKSFSQHRTILTGIYLRLQAQAYLKQLKIGPNATLTPDLKNQVLDYLGKANQIPAQTELTRLRYKQDNIEMKIQQTQSKINELETQADRLLGVYKKGVIGLTTAHLFGFGYMIFGVQWLGWDIIEPLTYSVLCLYTLLGMRFYRKFQKDRSQETIQEVLRRWAMRPSKRIALNEMKKRLLHEQRELSQLGLKAKLINNRLNPISTLPDDL